MERIPVSRPAPLDGDRFAIASRVEVSPADSLPERVFQPTPRARVHEPEPASPREGNWDFRDSAPARRFRTARRPFCPIHHRAQMIHLRTARPASKKRPIRWARPRRARRSAGCPPLRPSHRDLFEVRPLPPCADAGRRRSRPDPTPDRSGCRRVSCRRKLHSEPTSAEAADPCRVLSFACRARVKSGRPLRSHPNGHYVPPAPWHRRRSPGRQCDGAQGRTNPTTHQGSDVPYPRGWRLHPPTLCN